MSVAKCAFTLRSARQLIRRAGIAIACGVLMGANTGCITGLNVALPATAIPPTFDAPTLQAVPPGLTHRQVRNATYQSSFLATGKLHLQEGRFVDEGAAGAGKTVVQIDAHIALGDFNGDRFDDAATVLFNRIDAKSTLYELHLLRYRDGQSDHVAAYLLGADMEIREIKIQPGLIIVVTRMHSPLSSEKAPIEIDVTRTFKIAKNRLVEQTS